MSREVFRNEHFYDDADKELDLIAPKSKRAQWRHRRVGPRFVKFGRRVKYRGSDLNEFVEQSVVETNMAAF